MEQRYLHEWLRVNYKKVNEHWTHPPRLLGETSVLAAQQQQFLMLGQEIVSCMEKCIADNNPNIAKPIEFAIIRSNVLGAWAFWASKCYGIVVTQGLIENIQAVCGQVDRLMRGAMESPPDDNNFIRQLWAEMPDSNRDFQSYGEVLAQIAFDFIVHHELAHAGLGHEWVMATASASAELQCLSDEERTWSIDEVSFAAMPSGGSKFGAWRQALEADADLNGLRYTIDYLEMQAKIFVAKGKLGDDHRDIVWETVLTNSKLRWFAVLAGASIGLAALLSTPRKELGDLALSTHPPLPARILMVLHAGAQLQKLAMPTDPIITSEVLLLVSGLFGFLHFAHEGKIKSLDVLLNDFNLLEAVERYEEIGQHFSSLAQEMNALAATRDHLRRFPDFLRWEWYSSPEPPKMGIDYRLGASRS